MSKIKKSNKTCRIEEYVLDLEREQRVGFVEVIYGAGKTPNQVYEIFKKLLASNGKALATRCSDEALKLLKRKIRDIKINYIARVAWKKLDDDKNRDSEFDIDRGTDSDRDSDSECEAVKDRTITINGKDNVADKGLAVAVVAAGTSDMPVAEECAITLEFYGINVNRVYDVGVAGLHRLFERLEILRNSKIVIVIAGMEGALPSVVGGLISKPIIAVPTSVGYGANFSGLSALLTMLNSCASGITVVNIDNGFGAAIAALRIINSFEVQGKNV